MDRPLIRNQTTRLVIFCHWVQGLFVNLMQSLKGPSWTLSPQPFGDALKKIYELMGSDDASQEGYIPTLKTVVLQDQASCLFTACSRNYAISR